LGKTIKQLMALACTHHLATIPAIDALIMMLSDNAPAVRLAAINAMRQLSYGKER